MTMIRFPLWLFRLPYLKIGLIGIPFLITLIGPFIAPYAYDEPLSGAGESPSLAYWLGTDALGRDVLSRVLYGGMTIIGLSLIATVLAYILGTLFGLLSGFRDNKFSPVLIGIVDILMVLPAIVLMLLITAGIGPGMETLVISVTLVQLPSVARLVHVATVGISHSGYIDVAIVRGDSLPHVLLREVLPNVLHVIFADAGVRFGWSVTLIASMNFLGMGLPAPAADWGLMIAENREYLSANPWATLAPAMLLGSLTIGISSLLDFFSDARGRWSK